MRLRMSRRVFGRNSVRPEESMATGCNFRKVCILTVMLNERRYLASKSDGGDGSPKVSSFWCSLNDTSAVLIAIPESNDAFSSINFRRNLLIFLSESDKNC